MRTVCKLDSLQSKESSEFDRVLTLVSETRERTGALSKIDKADLNEAGGAGALSKRMLRDWYHFIYLSSLAESLGVELISVTAPENAFVQSVGRNKARSSLTLDGSITTVLGEMPLSQFSMLYSEARGSIARWRACSDKTPERQKRAVARTIAYEVEQASEERSLQNDWKTMLGGAILAAALALISALSDNIWLNGGAPVWLIVFVAWFINVIPNLFDMISWLKGVHSVTKTVMVLSTA